MRRGRPFRLPWRTRRSIAGDVDDEVRFHLEMRAAELVRNGMSETMARDEAIREFGNIDFTKRYCRAQDQAGERAMRWSEWADELRQNVGDAIRTLRRNPGYAAVAILTMLIGIGANAAIFTVTDAVMLKPLPFAEPGRLVLVHERKRTRPGLRGQMSAADVVDYRAAQTSMSAMGSIALGGYAFQPRDGTPTNIDVVQMTANMFDILGVRSALGRTFLPGEDTPDRKHVVVLSDGFWRRQLGADSSVVGRTITLQDQVYTVVGVMPPGFSLGYGEQVWIPLDVSRVLTYVYRARKMHFLYGVGRLKPGVTLEAVNADLDTIARRLEAQYPEANTGPHGFRARHAQRDGWGFASDDGSPRQCRSPRAAHRLREFGKHHRRSRRGAAARASCPRRAWCRSRAIDSTVDDGNNPAGSLGRNGRSHRRGMGNEGVAGAQPGDASALCARRARRTSRAFCGGRGRRQRTACRYYSLARRHARRPQ